MPAQPKPELTLFDSTCLIVGIIIGAGIYQMAPDIAKGAGGPWGVIGIWTLGGVLSLCGALSYAELATAYPREGGDYVYLSRAYGPAAGFLFGWVQLAIVRPGDIVVMAFAFATYARAIYDPLANTGFPHGQELYAVLAVVVLTTINVLGVRQGKWTQNLLTTAKALGLLLIVGAAYPQRNIVRALFLGMAAVTVLYLLVNAAFLYVLGYGGLTASKAVGVDAVSGVLPHLAGPLIAGLICVSALGAVNGLVFTGARISYAVGADHRLFRWLGQWHPRWSTPAAALVLQGVIAVGLIVVLGSFVNAVLYTAATVYSFYFATTLAVIVLRRKEPQVERPYRVLGYPWTPLVFAAVCVFLIRSAVLYKPWIAVVSFQLV